MTVLSDVQEAPILGRASLAYSGRSYLLELSGLVEQSVLIGKSLSYHGRKGSGDTRRLVGLADPHQNLGASLDAL